MANTEFLNLKLPATSDNIAEQINIDTPDNLSKIDASLKAVHTVTKESIAENYLSAHNIPSTAKRGKLDVKSKGLSAVNRIKNGNFAINDKTFWETSGYSNSFDIIDNVAKTTDYTASNRGFITKQMPVNSTDKYYCRFRTKVDNLDKLSFFRVLNGLLMGDGYLQYELATGWNTLSGIHTFTAGKQLRFFYSFIDAGIYPAYLDNVSFINLTTLFGAGNEPTKEQCDLMFANYFDGLQGAIPTVKSCGKNLFGGELETGSISTDDGTNRAGANNARSKDYINIKPNTQYNLTYSKPLSQTDIYYYDKNKVFISASVLGFTNNPNAFTTPNNAYFARIRYYVRGGVDISGNTMFEEGSTATPYEPYKGTEVQYKTLDGQPITLHKLPNGVYDEITDDGKFIKRIKEKTITESDVISMHTPFLNVDFAKIPKPPDYIGYNTFTNGNYKLGVYPEKPNVADNISYVGTVTGNAEETNFFIGVANETTLANAKTELAGTKLIYQLAQPQILDINATPLIAEPNGTVFITSESSPQPSVELSYPLNLGAVVEGLIEGQKRLSELVQSLITT